MSKLLQKSGFNFDSAQLLVNNHYYAPSIHCYYYSCHQKLLHIFYNVLNKTEADLTSLKRSTNLGSHEVVISEVYKSFGTNRFERRDFINHIGQLKKLRIDSDYKELEILSNTSTEAEKLVREINKIIKKVFNI